MTVIVRGYWISNGSEVAKRARILDRGVVGLWGPGSGVWGLGSWYGTLVHICHHSI